MKKSAIKFEQSEFVVIQVLFRYCGVCVHEPSHTGAANAQGCAKAGEPREQVRLSVSNRMLDAIPCQAGYVATSLVTGFAERSKIFKDRLAAVGKRNDMVKMENDSTLGRRTPPT